MEPMDVNGPRVWVDGCYDMVHFGHANSFRQSKALGEKLIVGVHSDAEITQHKGAPPVFTEEERYELVRANKWVDEVIEAAPYVTSMETLDRYNCAYCAHGDDITTTADGTDTYAHVKAAGRYKEVKRTQGVSTTELMKRLLKAGKYLATENYFNGSETDEESSGDSGRGSHGGGDSKVSPWTGGTGLILTTEKLKNFSGGAPPTPTDTVVYVSGTFDILHAGHVKFLKKARSLGTYLIVGVYSDEDASLISSNPATFPLMNLNERCYNILGCKYVSDIVIGAPLNISEDLLNHLNVKVVAHGRFSATSHPYTKQAFFHVAQQRGILQLVDSGSKLTVEDIVARIWRLRHVYDKRNKDKETKELSIINSSSQLQRSRALCSQEVEP